MSSLDDTARVYCEVTARQVQQQQGAEAVDKIDNGDLRRQAITDLVLARVATDVASERGVKIPPATEPEPEQFVDPFGAGRAPDVAQTLGEARDLYNLFVVIGGDEEATAVTEENANGLSATGRALVLSSFKDHEVRFAPRLGLSDDGEPNDSIGSLSVTSADAETPQPCRV